MIGIAGIGIAGIGIVVIGIVIGVQDIEEIIIEVQIFFTNGEIDWRRTDGVGGECGRGRGGGRNRG